jgi:glutaconate CoA-transferase, subunit B
MTAATTARDPSQADVLALIVCRLAHEIEDDAVVVLGSFTPLAYAAYMLAKLTHAPACCLVGYNAVDADAVEMSVLSSEAAMYRHSAARMGFRPLVNLIHLGGRGTVECVSSAQLDGDGAINLSAIGEYGRPKVRLPGGAGAPEVIQNYQKMMVYFARHDRRALVAQVDFVTGRRHPADSAGRTALGLPVGPIIVVTSLAVLTKDDDNPTFRITSLHPGVTAQRVVEETGFELFVPDQVPETALPTDEERALLARIDPFGTIAFDGMSGADRLTYLKGVIDQEWERAQKQLDRVGRR